MLFHKYNSLNRTFLGHRPPCSGANLIILSISNLPSTDLKLRDLMQVKPYEDIYNLVLHHPWTPFSSFMLKNNLNRRVNSQSTQQANLFFFFFSP